MATHTRGELKERINAGIKGKRGMLADFDGTIADVVRSVMTDELDLRSLRRKAAIAPGLFDDIYAHPLPVDIKGNRIISLHPQDLTNTYRRYSLIPFEDFGENRKVGTIAIDDHDQVRKLLVSAAIQGNVQRIADLDTITSGGGLWVLYGTTVNVTTDNNVYVYGNGSVAYDIGPAVGTTAGIQSSTLTAFDFSAHTTDNSSLFVYAYIEDVTGVTNLVARIGNNASNYHEITATQTHFGTTFVSGWNLVRFDYANRITTGTVDPTDGRYVVLGMTKLTTKVSVTGYRFDNLVIGTGVPQNLYYYSQYPWIDSITGARAQNASRDGDILVADEDEYNLFVWRGIEMAGVEVDELTTSQYAMQMFLKLKDSYGRNYPSESMLMTSDYQAQYYI